MQQCNCDTPKECYIRKSNTQKNPGRLFYTCRNGHCRFFKWVETDEDYVDDKINILEEELTDEYRKTHTMCQDTQNKTKAILKDTTVINTITDILRTGLNDDLSIEFKFLMDDLANRTNIIAPLSPDIQKRWDKFRKELTTNIGILKDERFILLH